MMKLGIKTLWAFLRETFAEFSQDKVPRLAAALSYYSLFSMAPLAIIAIGIAALVVGKKAATGALLTQIEGLIGHDGAQAIQTMVENARETPSGWFATVLGIVTLVVGATGVFAELQDALNTIWNVGAKPVRGVLATLRTRFLSFAMVLGIGFLLLISLVVSAAVAALGTCVGGVLPSSEALLHAVTFVLSLGVITILFALIFKLPDVHVAWRNVWIGGAVTAFLFSVGKFGIGLYLGKSSVSSAFGAAGAIVIVILWVYYSSLILFLGAEFTQVLTRWRDGKPQTDKAVRDGKSLELKKGVPAKRTGARVPRLQDAHALPVERRWKSLVIAAATLAVIEILDKLAAREWSSPRR